MYSTNETAPLYAASPAQGKHSVVASLTIACAAVVGIGIGVTLGASSTPESALYGVLPASRVVATGTASSAVAPVAPVHSGRIVPGPLRTQTPLSAAAQPYTTEMGPMQIATVQPALMATPTFWLLGSIVAASLALVARHYASAKRQMVPLQQLVYPPSHNDYGGMALFAATGEKGTGKVMLEIKDLEAVVAGTGQQILNGINLTIREGEVHAIMGKNGSGKSTLTKVLVGHPGYEVTGGSVTFRGKDLLKMEPEERSHAGLFLSFQSPIEVPGVSNTDFMRMSYNAKRKAQGLPEMDPIEFYGYLMPKLADLKMDPSFLSRNVNEGFSGGEKKRNEILQLAVLEADMALLDEIDSGLDVDALRDVAASVNGLKREDSGLLMITHYKRLLDLIEPDVIHIVKDGKVIQTGDKSLSSILEEDGFSAFA